MTERTTEQIVEALASGRARLGLVRAESLDGTSLLAEPGEIKAWSLSVDSYVGGRYDGCIAEWQIVWYRLYSDDRLSMRLMIFGSALPALAAIPDFFPALTRLGSTPTPEQVVETLHGLGFSENRMWQRKAVR